MTDAAAEPRTIVVRATQTGFAHGHRVRAGKTFTIPEEQFSPRWMEKTEPGTGDDLARARDASPKQRGPQGTTLKGQTPARPGTRRAETPDTGI